MPRCSFFGMYFQAQRFFIHAQPTNKPIKGILHFSYSVLFFVFVFVLSLAFPFGSFLGFSSLLFFFFNMLFSQFVRALSILIMVVLDSQFDNSKSLLNLVLMLVFYLLLCPVIFLLIAWTRCTR